MLRKGISFFILFILLISVTGCATAHKRKDLEIQGLKNQLSVLEAQVQEKDEEIAALRDSLAKTREQRTELTNVAGRKKVIGEIKSRHSVKQIQIALQNAGYNPGSIDGRAGRQTRDAIRAFQRANNLKSDGRVGKKTWDLLKEYLYKKVK